MMKPQRQSTQATSTISERYGVLTIAPQAKARNDASAASTAVNTSRQSHLNIAAAANLTPTNNVSATVLDNGYVELTVTVSYHEALKLLNTVTPLLPLLAMDH